MDTLYFRTLLIFVIKFIAYLNAIDFDEGCSVKDPVQLQVAFAMDQTGTFFRGGTQSFFSEFQRLVPQLLSEINKEYPGTQFALTTHADWESSSRPEFEEGSHDNLDLCYTNQIRFITNRTTFQTWVGRIKVKFSGLRENALAALAFTASTTRIRWIRNATTADGKPIRRVIVLVTDRDTGPLRSPGRRRDFRGDGTDTCRTSKPPTHQILREVLEKYEMTVIGLFGLSEGSGDLIKIYKDHFDAMGGNIPYCARSFSLKQQKGIMSRSGKIPKDFWKNQKEMAQLEERSESADYREKGSSKIEERALDERAGKFDEVIKFVIDCLKETKPGGCIFGDPEGFNTLGF